MRSVSVDEWKLDNHTTLMPPMVLWSCTFIVKEEESVRQLVIGSVIWDGTIRFVCVSCDHNHGILLQHISIRVGMSQSKSPSLSSSAKWACACSSSPRWMARAQRWWKGERKKTVRQSHRDTVSSLGHSSENEFSFFTSGSYCQSRANDTTCTQTL